MPGVVARGTSDFLAKDYLRRNPGVTATSRTINGKEVPFDDFNSGRLGHFFGSALGNQAIEAGLFDQGVQTPGTTRGAGIQSVTVTPKGGKPVDIPRDATREQVDALIKTVEKKRPKAPKAQPPKTTPDKPRGQPGAGGKAALLSDVPEDLTLGKPTLLGG